MRKLFFCLLLFGIATVFAEDGLRIAHVDSKIIFEGYKGTKNAQSEFDRQVAKWEQQANLLQKELAAIKERLDKQMLMLSDEKKRELEAEYAKKETELKDFISRVCKYTENIYVTTIVSDNDLGFTSMNGNIVVTSNTTGVSVNCSNNNTILKDTEWFAINRTNPWTTE